ncbi:MULTISPECIES: NADPH-dependent FMN reductase [unclassified Streptomyces]|uniref:NADPH-dependent FMN reductase n=1 Tax=unclassified Streptomyces TaxID=2593676 RepID=UPI002E110512|nr:MULTISPECIES: NADPH-dependent FMN reductase [unclassified Streptomyces]WSR21682.1 NADPH-dependent FMN reductase [Streptomyces sp. NBC_01205]
MPTLLALSGSPSPHSRTAVVADHVLRRLAHAGFDTAHLAVRELPAADLLSARRGEPELRRALAAVAEADGIIVATPVYKASYTGLLKAFLDLLPQDGLAGKTVLPIATGGSLAHVLTLDYALRPVLAALGARHVTAGRFVLDSSVERGAGPDRLRPEAELDLFQAVDEFAAALNATAPAISATSASAPSSALAATAP